MRRLTAQGQERLRRLRRANSRLSYSWAENTWGADRSGSVGLCVDQTSWVVDAKVAALPEDLRTADGFIAAVQGAYAAAELLRQMQSSMLDGNEARNEEIGAQLRASPIQPRHVRRSGRIELPEGVLSYSAPREILLKRDRVYCGTSKYREVTAKIRWNSGCVGVEVDPAWLRSTTSEEARFALKEAFGAAYKQGEDL